MFEHFIRSSLLHPTEFLKERLTNHGYVLLEGAIRQELIQNIANQILRQLSDADWIHGNGGETGRRVDPKNSHSQDSREYAEMITRIYRIEAIHQLARNLSIVDAIKRMLSCDEVLLHPNIVPRVVPPARAGRHMGQSVEHQDYPAFQGSNQTLTCWMPLHDCRIEDGALTVAAQSHKKGIRRHTISDTGELTLEGLQNACWHQGDLSSGDVLIFHNLTVHRGLANTTDLVRLSLDFRYQPAADPVTIPFFSEISVITGEPWTEVCESFADGSILESIQSGPKRYENFDLSHIRDRERLIIEQVKKGNILMLPQLQQLIERGTSDFVKQESRLLFERLSLA